LTNTDKKKLDCKIGLQLSFRGYWDEPTDWVHGSVFTLLKLFPIHLLYETTRIRVFDST